MSAHRIAVAGALRAAPVSTITREGTLINTKEPLAASVTTLGSAALQRAAAANPDAVRQQISRMDTDHGQTALASSATQSIDDVLPPLPGGTPSRTRGGRM